MTFYLESLGCAKNQVDSELIIAALERAGLSWVADPQEAELILVNTCGFIDSAKEESIRTALELKDLYPQRKVVVAGCLVQRYAAELGKELTEVDGLIDCRRPEEIARSVRALCGCGSRGPQDGVEGLFRERRRFLSLPGSAYVKLAEGCSNRCSYCAIPLIKGGLQSRSRRSILAEVQSLLERGIEEINLVAQDLCSYGLDRGAPELMALLEEFSTLKGDFWLRLLYLHPDRFPPRLPELLAAEPRILPYFDLPFQHASAPVLARMNRRGSREAYLELVGGIRQSLPQAVIRSTLLVGFPGEGEEDFRTLQDFQNEAELDWLGVFTYSREEGTPAFRYPGRVPRATALARKRALEQVQAGITQRRLERFVGRSLEVLVEEAVAGEGLYLGRAYIHAPEVDGAVVLQAGNLTPGRRVRARVARRNGIDLEAVPDLGR